MLITLEGIDGSGKTTVWEALKEREMFDECVFTREPTDSEYGTLLRENLKADTEDIFTELFLFMADHANHVADTIKPAISDNSVVICDRYIDSRCAYQGYTLNGDAHIQDAVRFVYGLHESWSYFPNVTILIDVSPETSIERLDSNEKYETVNKLRRVKENYELLSTIDNHRYHVVDGEQTKEDVIDDVTNIVSNYVA